MAPLPISALVPSLPSLGGIGSIGAPNPAAGVEGAGNVADFSNLLTSKIGALEASQQAADTAQTALATGKTTDVTSVILATEKASLNLELAATIRSRVVEAYSEIMRMQV